MKKTFSGATIIVVTLALYLLLTQFYNAPLFPEANASSRNDDWTMFRHDLNHAGYTSSDSSSNSARLLWAFPTMQAVWSSPSVVNGRVFVGCKDRNIYCLNSSNGKLIWYYSTGGEVNSSPAVDKGHVYIGSDDGYLYCLDFATGILSWKVEVGGSVRSCPAVLNDFVYIGSGNSNFFCFNASDGTTIWSYPTSYKVYSSPAVSNGIVYFACYDFYVYAINSTTGNEIWRQHTVSDIGSPSIFNGCVYTGSSIGNVCCLNASTGAKIWEYQTEDTVASSPAIAYGCVYVGSENNNVYCLNASNGNKIWETPTGYWVWSSPAIANGNVYVGSEDYNIYCLNASTGAKKWSYPTGNNVDSSPAIVNDTLYVGSHDYRIYALDISNSTVGIAPSKAIEAVQWGTIVFDAIVCAVGAMAIISVIFFIRSNRKKRRTIEERNISGNNLSWFSVHYDAICVLGILAFSSIFFVNLWRGYLWAADEQTYSQMAFHMVKNSDYLTPWAFGDYAIWAGKPPLLMWLISFAYQIFGATNFATRLWSAVFSTFSLVVIFYLGKKLYNPYVGLLSAIVLGTFTTFYSFATHAMTDGPLVFFILASLYFLILSEETKNTNLCAALSGLFFGLAFMTKQIEALLIALIIVTYLVATKRRIRFTFTKRLALFLGVAFLVFSPWLIYMNSRFGIDFWQCYFVYSTYIRTVSPIEGHAGGYLFYFYYLVNSENLLWVILLPFGAGLCAFNSVIRRSKEDILILIWMSIVLLIFTLAQTKLYWYILPALPAFAIAIGSFLYQLSKKIHFSKSTSLKDQKKNV
jgi:outer membrane protein assembly factor BamB